MLVSRSLFALALALLSTLLLGVGALLYARYIEPRWVEESHYSLQAPHWKGRPLRFVVLSDFHAKLGDEAYLDSIVARTLAAKPDFVLLLGDYLQESRFGNAMPPAALEHHLTPLAQLPCFAVLGNHDYDEHTAAIRAALQSFGAQLLDGKVQALELGGDTLHLSGMRCLCRFDTPGQPEELPQDTPVTSLLLTHSPSGAWFAPEGTTATFAGHTHGGQVCLPGGIPILRPDKRVRWEEMKGEMSIKGKPVYVTRGLGTSVMPLRFWCRPEMVVVEMRGE